MKISKMFDIYTHLSRIKNVCLRIQIARLLIRTSNVKLKEWLNK